MNKITKRALSGVPAVFVAAIGFTSSVAFRCFKSLKKKRKIKRETGSDCVGSVPFL